VRFHIQDEAAASGVIGVHQPGGASATSLAAPWAVLASLPPGPSLSQQAALIAHDGIAVDNYGHNITPPKH
jgi:hypothetical protein